jgi:hypothetical protein
MIPIKGQILGVRETVAAFAGIPSILRQAGQSAMTESLALFSKTVRDVYLVGPYPEYIERRTGSFRATFARGHADNIWKVEAQGSAVMGTFGSQDRRARILNDGGTIRSSRPGGYLAVRTEYTKDARGAVRAKYQQPLRNLPNTFVRMGPPRGGRQLRGTVFEKFGKRIVPIAWLVSYVVIIGRRFMERCEQQVGPRIPAIFQQKFNTVLTQLQNTLNRIGGR